MCSLYEVVSNHTERDTEALLTAVSSSVSLLSTLTMIILYICFSNLRQSSRGYLLMINICDFVTSSCFFLSSFHNWILDSFIIRQIEVCVFVNIEGLGVLYSVLLLK